MPSFDFDLDNWLRLMDSWGMPVSICCDGVVGNIITPTPKKKSHNIEFYPDSVDEFVHPIRIKDVRFSPPATIVFWSDGIKTVVKAQSGELYDKEKGLMACIVKRITGNTGKYNELFKKYIKEDK